MGDLERLWDDLPAGNPPTAEMIRAGRAPSGGGQQRRTRRRLLPAAGLTAGLVGAFAAGILVANPPSSPGGPGSSAPGASDATPVAFQGQLQAAGSCDELLDYLQERGRERVTAWGWSSGFSYPDVLEDFTADSESSSAGRAQAPAPSSQRSSETGTNVQETGVDEPDVVKTDGTVLVRIDDDEITTYDVSGERPQRSGSLHLNDFAEGEIMLTNDTVVALGVDPSKARDGSTGESVAAPTRLLNVDISDPAEPTVTRTIEITSATVAARQHGSTVRLVTSAGFPALDFKDPDDDDTTESEALAANRKVIDESTIKDWLPTYSVDGGKPKDLLDCSRVAIPEDDLGLDVLGVVGFDASEPDTLNTFGVAGAASISYESEDHLFLASGGSTGMPVLDCFGCRTGFEDEEGGTTQVFGFDIEGTGATYLGSAEVDGSLKDRWSMDEHDGVLRVAVGATAATGDFNSVVMLRPEGDALVEVGRLDKLGVGEEIKSVRWFDDLAIVVTFREIDPLYALDLTNQEQPTLLGELKIPGFSSYLHPLGKFRMLGIGEGPQRNGWGAQSALFNLADLSKPRRLDSVSYGSGTIARAGQDPRQFTWLPRQRVALTVVEEGSRGRTGYISVMRLAGGQITERRIEAEYGYDVDQLRTVPLPDGRVALVTGEGVRFLSLDRAA